MSYRKIGYGASREDDFDFDDDYYRTPTKSYGGGRTTSYSGRSNYGGSYSNGGSRWSWNPYSFSFDITEDDDNDLFVKGHDNYLTPRASDVKDKLWGRSGVSTDENIKMIKEFARFFYYRMVEEKDYMNEVFEDDTVISEGQLEEKTKKAPFYEELWDKFIPGYTPLEKAMTLFDEMLKKDKESGGKGENVADIDMRSSIDDVKFEEGIYGDPIYNELLDSNNFGKKYKNDILNKISLVKNLGSHFKVQKDIEEKVVQNTEITSRKMMRDYSQIPHVDLHQRLMPTFISNLATKNLSVTLPVDRTEHKQKIIILLDYSGSMHNTEKQQWVVAILIDRLKYAMEEEAEVFFSYFLHETSFMNFTHIHDRKSALEFWSKFSTEPTGGDTRIGDMIDFIGKEISEGRLKNLDVDLSEDRPEVLVLNDGRIGPY